ncbi:putative membrane protein [Synechococcus sp. SYN20]|nr:putative membrane protein [Synechococcus sp. SYN20]
MLQRLLKSSRKLGISLKFWDFLLILVIVVSAIFLVQFLGRENLDVISSRELLRLTSTPHIRNEAPDAATRGRPLKGAEILRDSQLLEAAKYKVYTGIYVANNFSLDLEVPSFSSKGYIWMRWGQSFQNYLVGRGLAVSEIISLENDINPETSVITPLRDVRKFDDGTFGQGMLYTGDFYIDNLDLRRFPFNSVSLPVVLEVDDSIGDLTYDSLRLIPDLRDSGIGQYSDLFGWLTRGWSFGEFRHHFASGLGVSAVDEEYSQLIFDVSYQRSSWSAFWTLIQPLVVVMASIVLITRVLTEFRVEIPIAVLLTLIFLQDGYRSELPNLPYLSFLDSVYAIAYLLSIVSFALVLYLESLKRRASLEQGDRRNLILNRIHIYEQSWPPISLLVMVLLSAASWLLI